MVLPLLEGSCSYTYSLILNVPEASSRIPDQEEYLLPWSKSAPLGRNYRPGEHRQSSTIASSPLHSLEHDVAPGFSPGEEKKATTAATTSPSMRVRPRGGHEPELAMTRRIMRTTTGDKYEDRHRVACGRANQPTGPPRAVLHAFTPALPGVPSVQVAKDIRIRSCVRLPSLRPKVPLVRLPDRRGAPYASAGMSRGGHEFWLLVAFGDLCSGCSRDRLVVRRPARVSVGPTCSKLQRITPEMVEGFHRLRLLEPQQFVEGKVEAGKSR